MMLTSHHSLHHTQAVLLADIQVAAVEPLAKDDDVQPEQVATAGHQHYPR